MITTTTLATMTSTTSIFSTDAVDAGAAASPWYASAVEIDAELSRQSAYHEEMERYDRQQWWSDLFWSIRHPFATLRWKLSERGLFRRPVVHDDEIPF